MPISLENFKTFANLPREAVPGTPAVGLLVLTKEAGHEAESFDIPSNSRFISNGLGYETLEDFQLSESATQLEVAITAQTPGIRGNLPANQVWTSPVANVVANNPAPLTQGADLIPSSKTDVSWENRPDSLIQIQLDAAVANIKTRLAKTDLPDDPRVDRAVYLLANFYMQNRSSQEVQHKLDEGSISRHETAYYRERVYQAIQLELSNLLNPFIDVAKFMPEVPS